MSKEKEDESVKMEIDDNKESENKTKEENDTNCIVIDDPSTPTVNNSSKLLHNSKSKSKLTSEQKLENAKKRQEEKEKRDKEKKEREEARIKREEEWRIKREEEARKKEENAKKREEERLKREEEKLKKEEERKEREEKLAQEKERKRLELLEIERKKQEQINAKNEEKRKKDEEKRLQEEEKLKEEEEKRKKEEKIKNKFVGFFIKKTINSTNDKDEQKQSRFMPFQPKENMRIAPIIRRSDIANMTHEERQNFICKLDETLYTSNNHETSFNKPDYLKELKRKIHSAVKFDNKCQKFQNDEDSNSDSCSIKELDINGKEQTKFKVKYLHFNPKMHKRPPYYGTWRKKSKKIKPRAPFAKDDKFFDYEIDSDDEWEDEPEGESICESEKDDDEEILDDEDDDGFFVPHGYLSDDELDEEERELDPEAKKAKVDSKKEQWEIDQKKKKSKVLIPKSFMTRNYWDSPEKNLKNNINELKFLERFKMVLLVTVLPVVVYDETLIQKKNLLTEESNLTPNSKGKNLKSADANESSPSSVAKITKSKSKKSLIGQQSSSLLTSTNSAAPISASNSPISKTPSIINFISKMSNKKVSMSKIDSMTTENQANSKDSTTNSTSQSIHPISLTNVISANSSTAPLSPKMTPNNSNVNNQAEKRVCSGNNESSVKRLRLDAESPSQEIKTLTIIKTGTKKSLKLQPISGGTESAISIAQPVSNIFSKVFNNNKKESGNSSSDKSENHVSDNVNKKPDNKENETDIPIVVIDD